MAVTNTEYQEFHHGEKEYCRESGPLNSRKTGFPPFAFTNGLALVTAAAGTVLFAAVLAVLYLMTTLQAIGTDSAVVNVNIYNRPEGAPVYYVLTRADDPDTVVAQGLLESDQQTLRFHGLQSDTAYVIDYFTEDEDGGLKKLDDFRFVTEKDPAPSTRPTVQTDPTAPATPTEPTKPSESTEPTEPSESTEPSEPTEPSESTEPTEPAEPTRPTEPAEPTRPTEPTEPRPTEPVRPTEPTEPRPTEPVRPTEPTEPTEPIVISTPKAQPAVLRSARAVTDSTDFLTGYRCTEVHTFTGVPSDDCTFTVTQNGKTLTVYTTAYDANRQTMTLTLLGEALAPGSSVTTRVTIVCADGGTAASTKTVTAPKLNTPVLTAVDNKNSYATFTLTGDAVLPSEGSVRFAVKLLPVGSDGEAYEANPASANGTYRYSQTVQVDQPGQTLTAEAVVYGYWSLDSGNTAMTASTRLEYTMTPPGQIIFELEDVYYYSEEYEYEMPGQRAVATFTNLDLAGVDASDVTVTFTSLMHTVVYNDAEDGPVLVYEEVDNIPLDQESYTVTVDPANGTVTASIIGMEDAIVMENMYQWTAVLTYRDAAGQTQKRTLVETLCLGYVTDVHVEAISYINSDGRTQVDAAFYVNNLPTNPGYLKLDSFYVSALNQYIYDGLQEERTEFGYIWRISFLQEFDYLSLQPHFYWSIDPFPTIHNREASALFHPWRHTATVHRQEDGTYTAEETILFTGLELEWRTYSYTLPEGAENASVAYDSDNGTCTITFTRTGVIPGTVSRVSLTNERDGNISTTQSAYTYP